MLTGFQCLNPALHTPDGQCLEEHTPGVSLRYLVAYIGQGNAARAYVADLSCTESVLSFRLVLSCPFKNVAQMAERYFEANMELHSVPKELFE